MPGHVASPRPLPYQSHYDPQVHVSPAGGISVTGTKVVDLGLKHNNFTVTLNLLSAAAGDANAASAMSWAYHPTIKGAFVISTWKATAAGTTTLIAATAAVNVSFVAYAEASVAQ